ncbi:MAG: tetratricopeptide repeat protein [Bryobacter sp.]|nr:tetratricopeptide repeat protein [Bryobacter sp.]
MLFVCASCQRKEAGPSVGEIEAKVVLQNAQREVREAVEEALSALRVQPDSARKSGELGMVLHAHQLLIPAKLAYQRAAALDPQAPDWPYYLADILQQEGKLEEARKLLAEVEGRAGAPASASLRLGEWALAAGDLDAAETWFQRAKESPADAPFALFGLGRCKQARKQWNEAQTIFAEVCRLYPRYAAARLSLAQVYQALGKAQEADRESKIYAQLGESAPPRVDALMAAVEERNRGSLYWLKEGSRLSALGQQEQAIAAIRKAVTQDPNSAQARANLINAYGRADKFAEAEAAYEEALAKGRVIADAHYNYGVVCFRQGKVPQAEQAFRRAVEANAQHSLARGNLGYLLIESKRGAEGEQQLRKAIEIDPANRQARYHLGRLLLARQDYAAAEEQLRTASLAAQDGEQPGYQYSWGLLLARLGRAEAGQVLADAEAIARRWGQLDFATRIASDRERLAQSKARQFPSAKGSQ